MNGAEHYQEAERLLDLVMASRVVHDTDAVNLAAAQVHATLAHAAAVIEAAWAPTRGEISDAWMQAAVLPTDSDTLEER